MRKDLDRSQLERRSARLAKTKRRIDVGDQPSASQDPEHHSASGSEEEQVVVGQVKVVVTPSSDQSNLVGPEVEVATRGERVEEEPSSEDEDDILRLPASSTADSKEMEAKMWTTGSRSSNPQPWLTKKNWLRSNGSSKVC